MQTVMRPIDSIVPYAANPRKNDHAVAAVAESIRRFGFQQPIVVDAAGIIIVGHTRYKAAKLLEMTEVPVIVADKLTPEQVKSYRIADNKLHELSDWDFKTLQSELAGIATEPLDLSGLGFSADELQRLLGTTITSGFSDPDSVPAPADAAVTQMGDIWILGSHRLMCGDSSKPDQLDQLLAGRTIQLTNTDPPYNVKVEPRSNNAIAAGLSSFTNDAASKKLKNDQGMAAFDVAKQRRKGKSGSTVTAEAPAKRQMRAKDRPLANDFVTDEEFDRLLDAWFGNIARVMDAGRSFYIWGGYANVANYPPFLKKHGLYFSQSIIWDKLHPVLTRKDFMGAHEWAFYGWKEGAGHQFFGPTNATDMWKLKKVNPQSMVHLTEKPVELAELAMTYSSRAGENVLDLFGGSGSTLIGAERTGRNAFLMELDPLYCDVIVKRYQQYTNRPAVLERTGESPIPMDATNA